MSANPVVNEKRTVTPGGIRTDWRTLTIGSRTAPVVPERRAFRARAAGERALRLWQQLDDLTELMLRDTTAAHDLRYVALRYFNVAGADPKLRALYEGIHKLESHEPLTSPIVAVAILAAALIIVGIQIFFSSFLLSIIGLRRRR